MNYFRTLRAVASALSGVALVAVYVACSNDRGGFSGSSGGVFPEKAGVDSGTCLSQCSLDGRSVIDTCTGQVVQTCPPELACGAGVCQEPCAAATADRSSNGCEFYMQPPEFTDLVDRGCYAAFVVNTSTHQVDLSLELLGKQLDLSKALFHTNPGEATLIPQTGPLAPGESAILFVSDRPEDPTASRVGKCPEGVVPATFDDTTPDGTGMGSSFHLVSNAPVSVATIFPFGGAATFVPTATLLLPVGTWAKEHVILNAWARVADRFNFTGRGPAAQIVASEDDTEVTILPSRDIQNGGGLVGTAAHVPATYRLNKGQVLQLCQAEELSGSIVSSTKPTSVFGGHECMFIPANRQACDIAQQQLLPFEQWGSEYVGVGYRPRLGNGRELMPYRIVAARDDTRLDYDPAIPAGAPTTMSAGEVVTFYADTNSPFVVRTQDPDHAIYLAAYMSGGHSAPIEGDVIGNVDFIGHGDPEFVNVIPSGQYLNSYSFYADPTYDDTSLVIVRAKTHGEFKDVSLDCAGNLTDFKPVGSRGDYEWTRVDLARDGGPGQAFGDKICRTGLNRMRSDGPFTATLWGWARYASYAYPSGLSLRKLVTTPLGLVH